VEHLGEALLRPRSLACYLKGMCVKPSAHLTLKVCLGLTMFLGLPELPAFRGPEILVSAKVGSGMAGPGSFLFRGKIAHSCALCTD
jgi:hypothetical protein